MSKYLLDICKRPSLSAPKSLQLFQKASTSLSEYASIHEQSLLLGTNISVYSSHFELWFLPKRKSLTDPIFTQILDFFQLGIANMWTTPRCEQPVAASNLCEGFVTTRIIVLMLQLIFSGVHNSETKFLLKPRTKITFYDLIFGEYG